jgi:hypothetical protein
MRIALHAPRPPLPPRELLPTQRHADVQTASQPPMRRREMLLEPPPRFVPR